MVDALEKQLPAGAGGGVSRGSVGRCGYYPRLLNDPAPTDDEHEREVRTCAAQSDHGGHTLPKWPGSVSYLGSLGG